VFFLFCFGVCVEIVFKRPSMRGLISPWTWTRGSCQKGPCSLGLSISLSSRFLDVHFIVCFQQTSPAPSSGGRWDPRPIRVWSNLTLLTDLIICFITTVCIYAICGSLHSLARVICTIDILTHYPALFRTFVWMNRP
jgi:hypothetical protein